MYIIEKSNYNKFNRRGCNLKAIILAGGLGTRLGSLTKKIPKPMVKINGKPIIEHIIEHYISFGVTEILVAGGYKYKVIKNYFKNKKMTAKVNVINTGLNSLTGLRIKKLQKFFNKKENFFMTYGDAISFVNLKKQLEFHLKNKKIATLLSVHPPARFGELKLNGFKVIQFEEKPQLQKGWINGGFFVLNYKIFSILSKKKNQMFEREPMQKLAGSKNLIAFKFKGFWMCMDTPRDKLLLEKKINLIKNSNNE